MHLILTGGNLNHVLRQCPFGQTDLKGIAWRILELLCISNDEIDLQLVKKKYVNNILLMHSAFVNQAANCFYLFFIFIFYSVVPTIFNYTNK